MATMNELFMRLGSVGRKGGKEALESIARHEVGHIAPQLIHSGKIRAGAAGAGFVGLGMAGRAAGRSSGANGLVPRSSGGATGMYGM